LITFLYLFTTDSFEKRDLHPGNVLYNLFGPQIGDLGLAISVSEASTIKDIKGVMPCLAPELLSGRGSYSQTTDVYAFGIIMWEITSGRPPFHDVNHDKYLALRIWKGLR